MVGKARNTIRRFYGQSARKTSTGIRFETFRDLICILLFNESVHRHSYAVNEPDNPTIHLVGIGDNRGDNVMDDLFKQARLFPDSIWKFASKICIGIGYFKHEIKT